MTSERTAVYQQLLDDLAAEEKDLDAVVASLDDAGWSTPTPAKGWDVRDQIAHLALSEELAALAATEPAAFTARLDELLAAVAASAGETSELLVGGGRSVLGQQVLSWWREGCRATLDGLARSEPRSRLPWFAGAMSAMSFATARLMETWAHGQDVVDALNVVRTPTDRLRHIADLGVRTRPYAYGARGRTVPNVDVHVELDAPDGSTWEWGESAKDIVRGPALDFCLVVTQRRNPLDTSLDIRGERAHEWIGIAQAFAGPATDNRPPAPA